MRSYDSCRIEFDSGTTLLIGDIGCGKSTILMAIEFALFGFGGQKSDALLSKGKQSGSIKLAFESNGRSYEIYRAIKESGGKIGQNAKSAWISEDGVKDDTLGVGEMKQKVIQILGTDEPAGTSAETSIFRYAVYTPQEDMQAVLADPKKRTETIRRAFKIDGFAVARENAKKVVSEIKRTMKEYSIRFEDVPQLEEKLASHQDMAKDLKGNIALLDADAKAAGVEVRSCEAAYSKAEKERDAKNKASSEADVLESQIEGIRENIGKATREADGYRAAMVPLKEKLDAGAIPKPHSTMTLRQLDVSMERLRPDADELIRVTAKMDSLDAEIKSLQAGIADHAADVGELQVRVDLMQAELEDAKSSRDDLVARGSVLRGKVRMLEENAESLEHDDSCPLCMQGLHGTDGKEAAKTVGKRIMSLKSNLDEISVQAKEANALISKTESTISDAREQLQAARDAEETGDIISTKTADFESLASKARPLQKAKSRLGDLDGLRRSVAEYEDAIHDLKDAKAALESLRHNP